LPEIKRRFDEEGIEIPFPHRTVYTGSMSEPFPIQVIQPDKAEDAAEAENLR
jgi:small-conductance mechanosensitive channel